MHRRKVKRTMPIKYNFCFTCKNINEFIIVVTPVFNNYHSSFYFNVKIQKFSFFFYLLLLIPYQVLICFFFVLLSNVLLFSSCILFIYTVFNLFSIYCSLFKVLLVMLHVMRPPIAFKFYPFQRMITLNFLSDRENCIHFVSHFFVPLPVM